MANLGFSLDTYSRAGAEPRRRVGTRIHHVDSFIEMRERAPIEIYAGLVVIAVAIAAMIYPDRAALLLSQLKALF